MKATLKLSGEDRRAAIIKAVRRVFAEKGFDGTTTRELADAAEVSEALMFKHFPNKEALYAAMQQSCCHEQDPGMMERIKALEPSASTLVIMVHLLFARFIGSRNFCDEDEGIKLRLFLRSLMEDGEFARVLVFGLRVKSGWMDKIEDCLKAAAASGEMIQTPVRPNLAAWFTQHLAVFMMLHLRPETPVVDYGVSREKLMEQAVWFTLRGMGLQEDVIRRCYNPKALALFLK